MPKLNPATRKKVDAAEAQDFAPIPDGVYVLKLAEDVEIRTGGKGDYWNLKLRVVGPTNENRIIFTRLFPNSDKPGAYGIIKAFYAAVGEELDTETEDLVGVTFRARVGHETQTQGAGAGNVNNNIRGYLPKDEEKEEELLEEADSDSDDPMAAEPEEEEDEEEEEEAPAPRKRRRSSGAAKSELFEE